MILTLPLYWISSFSDILMHISYILWLKNVIYTWKGNISSHSLRAILRLCAHTLDVNYIWATESSQNMFVSVLSRRCTEYKTRGTSNDCALKANRPYSHTYFLSCRAHGEQLTHWDNECEAASS